MPTNLSSLITFKFIFSFSVLRVYFKLLRGALETLRDLSLAYASLVGRLKPSFERGSVIWWAVVFSSLLVTQLTKGIRMLVMLLFLSSISFGTFPLEFRTW
jgi:hypothetical protein